MSLKELTIGEFIDLLASDAPTPGGGGAAAISCALASALTMMVASLTTGKEKYGEYEQLTRKILDKAGTLKNLSLMAADQDADAFGHVAAVFGMPKGTQEEKDARKVAMQTALKASAAVPLKAMEYALEILELTESAVGRSNANVASDLGVSALSAKAAVQSAWLNVVVNLSGINDQNFVSEYRAAGEEILNKALPLADKIYEDVLKSL